MVDAVESLSALRGVGVFLGTWSQVWGAMSGNCRNVFPLGDIKKGDLGVVSYRFCRRERRPGLQRPF